MYRVGEGDRKIKSRISKAKVDLVSSSKKAKDDILSSSKKAKDDIASSSRKGAQVFKSFLQRGTKLVRGLTENSFQTTDSEAVSETAESSGAVLSASPLHLLDQRRDARVPSAIAHSTSLSSYEKKISKNMKRLFRPLKAKLRRSDANDNSSSGGNRSRSLGASGKSSSASGKSRSISRKSRSVSRKSRSVSRKSRTSSRRSKSSSGRSEEDWSENMDQFDSSINILPRMSRAMSFELGELNDDADDDEDVSELDLSFSIMPQMDLSREYDSETDEDVDLVKTLDRSVEKSERVQLLAVSRTPSFNIMLHSNQFYSDSCTLLKRKTVRITWEDLEHNNMEIMHDSVPDISGRRLSEMTLKRTSLNRSEMFGVNKMLSRGSLLVRQPSIERKGKGGIPLWSHTSIIQTNDDFSSFVLHERVKDWLKNFKTCDPRFKILKFFNDVANEGATGDSKNFVRDHVSPLLRHFNRSSVFTVWRPTSLQAIRRMMLGEGVGKGLDIKGKSAKRGKLSAFVPFLQIFKEADKGRVRTLRKNSKIRIFFNSKRDRDIVVKNLNELAEELVETVRAARRILKHKSKHDEETVEGAMQKMTLDMDDPTINVIDMYASSNKYGMEVQERLFWEGMVIRQKIVRKPGSADDIGRTSMPSFQDMNFSSLREPKNDISGGHARAVIVQFNPPDGEKLDPMNPLNLLMAYEENDPEKNLRRVIPVVSDFDCFIVGTRGVRYEEKVPKDQIEILKWMVQKTETVLKKPTTEPWTKRWVNVLKDSYNKGFHPEVPPGGYSDPKTRFIFKHAVNRLSDTGAVRHGAECYNYYFPQELDNELLVISDDLPEQYSGRNWVYVDQVELQEILRFKIDMGYTFPLNPKWVLCDPGWKGIYDKVMASNKANVQQSLDCFYPPDSGLRELIEEVHEKYPNGFQRVPDDIQRRRDSFRRHGRSARFSQIDGTMAMDLAEQELKYYFVLERAKKRLKAYLLMNRILEDLRDGHDKENEMEGGNGKDDELDHKEQGPMVEESIRIESVQS